MDVMKEKWETPRTEYERFEPNMYCVNCDGLGHWEVVTTPQQFHPSQKFYIDANNNKKYDKEIDYRQTTDGRSPGGISIEQSEMNWGWVAENTVGEPNVALVYKGHGNQWYAYHLDDVFIEHNAS